MHILSYGDSNQAARDSHIRINRITHFCVDKDEFGNWAVWEMTSPNSGWPTPYDDQEEANIAAKKCSQLTGLPIKDAPNST